jgi:hypothetical protein
MSLKLLIKKWLFKEELEKINNLFKDSRYDIDYNRSGISELSNDIYEVTTSVRHLEDKLNNTIERYSTATKDLKEAKESYDDARKLITRMVDVGIDVNPMETDRNPSWAVICIDGKQQFTEFTSLNRYEAIDVLRFLRAFKDSNRKVIDSPFSKGMLKDFGW